jgi:hypothetical protein
MSELIHMMSTQDNMSELIHMSTQDNMSELILMSTQDNMSRVDPHVYPG